MSLDDINNLRNCCKNEQCFQEVKEVIDRLADEKEYNEHCLSLLESAISNDYDSILITELNLEKPGPEIVYVNDGFCEMTGYTKEEVIGKTPRILQGPKTDPKVLEKLKNRLTNGQCFFGQTVNYRKDGSEFINQWDIHPLTDEEGNSTHWVSYQHDITERKLAEKQFVDTKIEFDDLREKTHCTEIDIDVNGNIISANNAFLSLTGYQKEELKQIKIWELFPAKYIESLKDRFDEPDVIEEQEFNTIIKHKSGIPIQVKGTTQLLDLKNKQIIRAEIQNVSLQKRVKEALKKRSYELSKQLDEEATPSE